ncbi:Adaptin domain-containing protein isoform 1 [Cladophialophora immunda]|nr:Adaptin domain-containing protein isoform 1 [Cladophialophora immunda]
MDPSWLQYADPTPARDLTVEAAQSISKAIKGGSSSARNNMPFAKLKALLDSRSDRDILDGLKRVVSMMYQNKLCLPYFSSVVKNVANPSLEVKKLVYIYLLHYAESDPDLDESEETVDTDEVIEVLDPDLELFLKACRPLLQSRSAAVIISVTSCFLYLGTPDYLREAVGPLIGLMRGPPEVEEVALCNIVLVALSAPDLFVPYASHFLIRAQDSPQIWRLKIELQTLIFAHAALHLKSIILSELEHFSHSADVELTRESVRAIGRCAQSDPKDAHRCFQVLLNQISSFDNILVSEVLTVMRHLIQQDPASHRKTVVRLARNLDKTTSPEARATIIWLVGEFASLDPDNNIAPDVLRILAKGFADESESAKQQIVLLAAKVYLLFLQRESSGPRGETTDAAESQGNLSEELHVSADLNHPISKLWNYVQLLARYDTSYDLRDRARLFKALLANPASTQLAALLLLAPKPVPHSPSPSESRKGLMLGSTTLVLGTDVAGILGLPGYEQLPDWVSEGLEPDPKLRDAADGGEKDEYVPIGGRTTSSVAASRRLDEAVKERGLEKVVAAGTTKANAKPRTLDDWLAESEEEEEEESEEETESEETDEEESEEGETEEESEDERGMTRGLMASRPS